MASSARRRSGSDSSRSSACARAEMLASGLLISWLAPYANSLRASSFAASRPAAGARLGWRRDVVMPGSACQPEDGSEDASGAARSIGARRKRSGLLGRDRFHVEQLAHPGDQLVDVKRLFHE